VSKNDRYQDSGKDWAERSKTMMAWAVRNAAGMRESRAEQWQC